MTDVSADSGPLPVFGPDGKMMGNMTSNQGQPPTSQPSDAPPLQRYGQQMEGVQKADEAAFAQRNAAMLKPMSALSSMHSQPVPQAPDQQKLGPAPDAKDYQQNAMAFASAMAVLGAVASKFTRVSGTASLSAFAGALKGWQTGNLQAYEDAAKKWEQDTKATLENNRQIMDKYKLALEDRKMNIDEQMSQIQLVSAQYHDQIMYDAAAAKNYTLVAQIYEKNQEYTQKATVAAAKLQESRDKDRQKNEQSGAYWLSPEGQAKFQQLQPSQQAAVKQLIDIYASKNAKPQNAALTKFLEENPTATAQQIQHFQQAAHPPRSASGMSLQQFKEENPNATSADIQEFQARQSEMNAAARTKGGREANLDIILRVTDSAIPAALEASEKVPRGGWV